MAPVCEPVGTDVALSTNTVLPVSNQKLKASPGVPSELPSNAVAVPSASARLLPAPAGVNEMFSSYWPVDCPP